MFLDPRSAELDRDRLTRRAARYLASLGGAGEAAPEVLVARYDDDPHLPTPGDVWSAIQTDGEMRRPADAMAERTRRDPRRHVRVPLRRARWPGGSPTCAACHASDLPYPFGTVEPPAAEVVGPGRTGAGRRDAGGLGRVRPAGDPSCDELGSWPAYDTDRRATMLLAADVHGSVDDPDGDRRQAWAELAPVRSDRPS